YLVNETLAGRGERLNQTGIAIDVLGKDARFDPAVDSVVRVEAGRLRTKLREYYHEVGRQDEVRVDLPKGLYVPRISFGAEPEISGETRDAGAGAKPSAADAAATPGTVSPMGVRQHILLAASAALIAMGAAILIIYEHEEAKDGAPPAVAGADAAAKSAPAPAYQGGKAIAVLPFANSSAEQEDAAFFADGLHDDLLTQLTKIADLKVISRTSVMGYRDGAKPVRQIADELGVNAVLEGTVQRAGDRVRVNVQLIDGRTDQHIWAESFDEVCDTTNVFEIQRRIALKIAAGLHAELSPQEEQRLAVLPTRSMEAYEAYLRARQRVARRTLADMAEAAGLYQQAIGFDPEFALAQVGLAETAYLQYVYGGMQRDAMLETALPALDRAFAANDQSGEAYTVLGAVRVLQGDEPAAEEAFRRAIELNPNYAQAYHWYGSLVERLANRMDEALRLAQRARELDPLSPLLRANLALILDALGRFDQARAELEKAIELEPGFPVAYATMGILKIYAWADVAEAMQWFSRAIELDPKSEAVGGMALAYGVLGETQAAQRWMEKFLAGLDDSDQRTVKQAMLEHAMGNDERAAEYAGRLVFQSGQLADNARPMLLSILRNVDLKRERYAKARERYASTMPGLFTASPDVNRLNYRAAIDLALVLQRLGESDPADRLLDRAGITIGTMPRLGTEGYGLAEVEIAALRGDRDAALSALRKAV
ncbi:MAG: tetratricopeptide repeat protein, partial [Burkholderiales bacterium]